MIIKPKRRIIVQALHATIRDPNSPLFYTTDGIEDKNFHKILVEKFFIKEGFKKTDWSSRNLLSYIEYCIQDGYITVHNSNHLKISSKGEDFIDWPYYPSIILNHWTTKHILSLTIGIIIGWIAHNYLHIPIY